RAPELRLYVDSENHVVMSEHLYVEINNILSKTNKLKLDFFYSPNEFSVNETEEQVQTGQTGLKTPRSRSNREKLAKNTKRAGQPDKL
ncbi:hypothetical protein WMY93_034033, partial [Mugilogobius chulae]